jgi:hypothetical protein
LDLLLTRQTDRLTMKSLLLTSLSLLLMVLSTVAQAPAPNGKNEEQLLALAKEVQLQQAQIVANQSKIDAKLTDVAEAIRMARIFSSRGR